jgi:soluble lytic murein transglycosylase-like protein
MDYDKAEQIRKKSFGSLLGEQEGGLGTSLKSAISQKTQAKMTGIKEKFDPMNIARAIGGKTGAAVYGKIFGRDQKSMERFAGTRKKRISATDDIGKASSDSSPVDVLGLIYRMMLRNAEDEKLQNELKRNKGEEEDKEEEDRNQQLIRALTGRKKPTIKKEKEKEKKPEEEKPTEPSKPTVPKGKGKAPTKAPEKPATKEAPKAPTKAPEVKPKVEKAPEVPKLKVEKAPEVLKPKVKAPPKVTPKEAPKVPSVSTAAKVAAGTAIVGGLLMPKETVAKDIDRASKEVGVDKSLMYAMAKQESGFNPSAAAKTSSAKGLYQFIKGTWEGMVKKYGSKYPVLQEKGPEDSYANALAGALFIKENSDYLAKSNIPINATTIYAAHFLGPGGAKKLLTADPSANAAELMPQAANANDFIFYNKTNNKLDKSKPRTVQEVIDALFQKVGKYQEKYATALAQIDSGENIDNASKENKDLKNTKNDKSAPTVINNNTNTQQNSTNKPKRQEEDDRSAYQKKTQG